MPSGMEIGGGQKGILLEIVSMPTRSIESLHARKGTDQEKEEGKGTGTGTGKFKGGGQG